MELNPSGADKNIDWYRIYELIESRQYDDLQKEAEQNMDVNALKYIIVLLTERLMDTGI